MAPGSAPWRLQSRAQPHPLAVPAQLHHVFKATRLNSGRGMDVRSERLRIDNLFQSVQAEGEPDRRGVMTKLGRKTVISAATGDFEPETANIGPKENAAVIIEASYLSQVDRQTSVQSQPFEYSVNVFEMFDGTDRPFVRDQLTSPGESFRASRSDAGSQAECPFAAFRN